MAVGFVASATSGSQASVASFSIGTLGTGARAGIVFVATHGTGDLITSVTWNGVAMTRLFQAVDTDTEPGSVVAYFLDNVANGTITVNRTNNAVVTVGYAASISAASATGVWQTITRVSSTQNTNANTSTTGTGASGEVAVDDGTRPTNSMRFAAAYTGAASPVIQGTNSSLLQSLDSTALGSSFVRETTAGTGSRNVGFATGTTDDWAMVAVAVSEINVTATGAISVPSATVAGSGSEVFTSTGAISVPSATVAGTGAEIFTATGSTFLLPDGIVSQSQFAGSTLAEFQTEDADIAAATGTSAAVRLSFPTPGTTPRTGGTSRLEALIYAGTSDTTTTVEYHESGSLVLGSGNIVVAANTNRWISLDIPNASLSDLAGGQARITLDVTGAGVDIVRWLIDAGMSVSAPTVAGTGTHTLSAPSGTGAISVPAATMAGTGAIVLTGTGSVTVPAATVAGTGAETFTATGAITGTAPTVAGTAAEVFTATGAVAVPSATVAGSGAESFTATGAITVPAATTVGTGALGLTATGAISVPAATVDGTGIQTVTAIGTGSIAIPSATVAGDGLHTANATGSGAIQVAAATVAGLGDEVFTGTGDIVGQPILISGTGEHAEAVPVTGTGAISVPAARVAGVGSQGFPVDLPLELAITDQPEARMTVAHSAGSELSVADSPSVTMTIEAD